MELIILVGNGAAEASADWEMADSQLSFFYGTERELIRDATLGNFSYQRVFGMLENCWVYLTVF